MQPEKIQSHFAEPSLIMMPRRSAEFDIDKEVEELRHSPAWESGIARKVLIRDPDLQLTLRRMKGNTRIPEHHNPGRISVQIIFGHIQMHADGKLFDLPQGRVLVLDRAITHDLEALEESAFLLTVAYSESAAH